MVMSWAVGNISAAVVKVVTKGYGNVPKLAKAAFCKHEHWQGVQTMVLLRLVKQQRRQHNKPNNDDTRWVDWKKRFDVNNTHRISVS